ncbi:protocatechuate 3,4-dioxygenase [Vibrio sp. CAU 1672]|uniref:protocatechuate 3,4-dioxygenase n=1 Tax=Vibrio sp. CAU 1672 TaxID=3032594 RepID=UPI0023DACB09|nr:protocatechuate 3,4-dioxygenase [Vibrio sp. CAU 1672]MDF2153402.1 protocatechuate 3,4-dioxygenase [Vibrio sp. CAU 1672]
MLRRQFLSLWALLCAPSINAANQRKVTPAQAEGPFYPVEPIPLRSDLVLQADGLVGESLWLQGRVLDREGKPVAGVRVEIWQCDGLGIYHHPGQPNHQRFDRHFAGFGAVITAEDGRYSFHTISPVPYNTRPPHIHVKLWRAQRQLLTTQLYLKGQTGSEWWAGRERQHLQIESLNINGRQTGEFNFVLAL